MSGQSESNPIEEDSPERKATRTIINREVMEGLQKILTEDPSVEIVRAFSDVCLEIRRKYTPRWEQLLQERQSPGSPSPPLLRSPSPPPLRSPSPPPLRSPSPPLFESFPYRYEGYKFFVVSPLSDTVKALVLDEGHGDCHEGNDTDLEDGHGEDEDDHGEDEDGHGEDEDDRIDQGVRRILKKGKVLATLQDSGGVIRCRGSDGRLLDIVIKIVFASHCTDTEYSCMQYLAENFPDFPAPKPHGYVFIVDCALIFMSYIPSTTLMDAWPKLTPHHKVSIQGQLDRLFTQLRSIKLPLGGRLGGTAGEGVCDNHTCVDHTNSRNIIQTASAFRDFQFAIDSPCDPEYSDFLKSLLPPPDPNEPAVFTHGDVFPGNIMVDIDPSNPTEYVVTGIIDWEFSGFYPAWYEATKVLYTFTEYGGLNGRTGLEDWWQYVPRCIHPASYPVEWAIYRLWDKAIDIDDIDA